MVRLLVVFLTFSSVASLSPTARGRRRISLRAQQSEQEVRAVLNERRAEDTRVVPKAAAERAPLIPAAELDLLPFFLEKALVAVEGKESSTVAKEKIVVLGSGWAAAALVSKLGADADVTVISPRNYFLFTPMLAGAAVGTVEFRSICQPLRSLSPSLDYYEAAATSIDVSRKVVVCEAVLCKGASCAIDEFEVGYDRVVVATGATTNTFGVPGVREHCLFLREISDANLLRQSIGNCFERANLPTLPDAERRRALSFVVVGAGPTGVEFCAELRDFLLSEGSRFYPNLLPLVKVTLLEATNSILGVFDEELRDVAIETLRLRIDKDQTTISPVDVRLGAAVSLVNESHVLIGDESLAYGACIWATGNGASRLVTETIAAMPSPQADYQYATRGRIATDEWMRVYGAPKGEVFALGDCAAYSANPLPATAQVAAQQGEFLARLLVRYDSSVEKPTRRSGGSLAELFCDRDDAGLVVARPFQFLNLGILAYLGDNKALAQIGKGGRVAVTGRAGFALWRSVYLAKQLSIRNRILVAGDWARARVFGRDITRF